MLIAWILLDESDVQEALNAASAVGDGTAFKRVLKDMLYPIALPMVHPNSGKDGFIKVSSQAI
jgi:hypothetical protein